MYETTGNKTKTQTKNCLTHVYCNNTCLFHTMRIVVRAPHVVNRCGGFPRLVKIFQLLRHGD